MVRFDVVFILRFSSGHCTVLAALRQPCCGGAISSLHRERAASGWINYTQTARALQRQITWRMRRIGSDQLYAARAELLAIGWRKHTIGWQAVADAA